MASLETKRLPRRIAAISKGDSDDNGGIRFSTVASFKGLEADAILLLV
jgi:hypothetical protein